MPDPTKDWEALSPSERRYRLYLNQRELLDGFLSRGAITAAQYKKSLGDLTEKMNIVTDADGNPRGIAVTGDPMERILRSHALRYPEMRERDAVKLVYQSEYGGGHLLSDGESFRENLTRELSAIPFDPSVPLTEELGNGMVRCNLAALSPERFSAEDLIRACLASAGEHRGSEAGFLRGIGLLRQLAGEGIFRFGAKELNAFVDEYAANGYPVFSHSEEYRAAYRPAYRVLLKKYM